MANKPPLRVCENLMRSLRIAIGKGVTNGGLWFQWVGKQVLWKLQTQLITLLFTIRCIYPLPKLLKLPDQILILYLYCKLYLFHGFKRPIIFLILNDIFYNWRLVGILTQSAGWESFLFTIIIRKRDAVVIISRFKAYWFSLSVNISSVKKAIRRPNLFFSIMFFLSFN